MRLVLETRTGGHEIAISATQEPFAEIREIARREVPVCLVCDSDARHLIDVHALRAEKDLQFFMGFIKKDSIIVSWRGIPIEVTDAPIEACLDGRNPRLAVYSSGEFATRN